ncbi:MAG TPA: hypothetical protein PKE55_11175 [Kiritimatiellia bacterium]|nr:hypothetical protein [Kiritimatiellia bacterium]
MDKQTLDDLQLDRANLYREETITDLRTGTIRVLTPIKEDASHDDARPSIFMCQTEVMTNAGPLPISARIDATTLSAAIDKFPSTIQAAIEEMIQRVQNYQREQASRLVTPADLSGKGQIIPGAFGGGAKGGGNLII